MNGTSADGAAIFKYRGEVMLLAGLVVWCFAFAPYFPILLLVAQLFIGPVALLLLLVSTWQARDRTASTLRQILSLLLFVIALVALYCSSLQTVSMAHRIFPPPRGTVAPTALQWAVTIATWFLSAILWWFWLRNWTAWPKQRCFVWSAAVFGVHFVIAIVFWLILLTDPPRSA